MKRFVFVAVLAVSVIFVSAQSRAGDFLFQAGLGLGLPKYASSMETVLDAVEDVPGVTRVKVALDLNLGFAVTEDAFIMIGVDGCGDRLSDSSGWMQLNSYLFNAGLRYYPMHTGVYIGACAGSAKQIVSDSTGTNVSSPAGFGWGAGIGYDFGKETGFGLALEAKYDSLSIEGDKTGIFMLTVNLLWK
jgi:hypothetical protein